MKSIFNIDGPVIGILNRIADILLLNLLCLVCCIPLITIGPSITALYYCTLKISRDQDTSLFKMFFHSFTQNFKQGLLLGLIFVGTALFLIWDIYLCNIIGAAYLRIVQLFILILLFVFVCVGSYAFPLLAQFHNSTKNTLRNAFLLAIYNFQYTVIMAVLNLFPILLFVIIPRLFAMTLMIWVTIGFSCIAMLNSTILIKIFDRYITAGEI